MQNFTLNDLTEFIQKEDEILDEIGLPKNGEDEFSYRAPQRAVDAVLNYSRALSVRKTENLGNISMLLN